MAQCNREHVAVAVISEPAVQTRRLVLGMSLSLKCFYTAGKGALFPQLINMHQALLPGPEVLSVFERTGILGLLSDLMFLVKSAVTIR